MTQSRRILITECNKPVIRTITDAIEEFGAEYLVAKDGEKCLDAIEEFKPDLIIFDVAASKLHGMDLLKHLKSEESSQNIGVIITTPHAVAQDYNLVIKQGADYCLLKPFSVDKIREVIERFYDGTLTPEPFQGPEPTVENSEELYLPQRGDWSSYVKFWGTRGSIPVSGVEYHRYGGNTSCLEVRDGDDLVIIDAGTGIRELGNKIAQEGIRNVHLFIGHTHWDHIIGFPFFAPVYNAECTIHIYSSRGYRRSSEELFTGMLEHDFFPVRFEEMQASFQFHDLSDFKPVRVGNLRVHYGTASHPGNTLFFKVESRNSMIGYATDNEFLVGYQGHPSKIDRRHPLLEPYLDVIRFFTGCDILIHEAQYTPEEYQIKSGWGHSSIPNAAILAKHCRTPRWVITHHDPANDDIQVGQNLELQRDILKDNGMDINSHMAYDGLAIQL
jgi:phosphoribosyl 1,2-cyclic phosphodiesterase/CheY-like chemotaxis protein